MQRSSLMATRSSESSNLGVRLSSTEMWYGRVWTRIQGFKDSRMDKALLNTIPNYPSHSFLQDDASSCASGPMCIRILTWTPGHQASKASHKDTWVLLFLCFILFHFISLLCTAIYHLCMWQSDWQSLGNTFTVEHFKNWCWTIRIDPTTSRRNKRFTPWILPGYTCSYSLANAVLLPTEEVPVKVLAKPNRSEIRSVDPSCNLHLLPRHCVSCHEVGQVT